MLHVAVRLCCRPTDASPMSCQGWCQPATRVCCRQEPQASSCSDESEASEPGADRSLDSPGYRHWTQRLQNHQCTWSCQQLVDARLAADPGEDEHPHWREYRWGSVPAIFPQRLVMYSLCAPPDVPHTASCTMLLQVGLLAEPADDPAYGTDGLSMLQQFVLESCVASVAMQELSRNNAGTPWIVSGKTYITPAFEDFSFGYLGDSLGSIMSVPVLSVKASRQEECSVVLELLVREV